MLGQISNMFESGEYVRHFQPEDASNPFQELYIQKKREVLQFVDVEGKRILDVGGGMGRIAIPLSRRNQVWLCDLSQAMLDLARADCESPNLHTVRADARDLPFENESFDYVIALDLICHLPDPVEGLVGFRRVLKKDGILIVDSTNSNPLWTFFFPSYVGRRPTRWLKTLTYGGVLPGWEKTVKHYRKNEFHRFLYEAGFSPFKWRHYGPWLIPKWHLAMATQLPTRT